jgi:O-antigen ligase
VIASINKSRIHFGLFAGLFIFSLLPAIWTGQYLWIAVPFLVLFLYSGWQHLDVVFFLLLLSLPFSAEYHFTAELGTDIPDEFLMIFVFALALFYFSYSSKTVSKNTWRHPLITFLVISLAWILITVFFSTYSILSLKFLLAKCWYAGAFVLAPLIIFKQKKTIRSAAVILAASLVAVTVIILIRHARYHFSFADVNKAVSPFFRNHVNYSAMLVCCIPLFFAFHKLSPEANKKLLIKGAILVLLVALFFSYARGAWLALFAGLAAYWLIRKNFLFPSFIAAVIITIGLLIWIKNNDRYLRFANDYKTTIYHKDFREHLVATYTLKDISTAERFYRWIAGVRMIKDNWLTGYGPNTFYYNYKPYAVPAFKTWVSDNKDHSTVHNYFLLIAIEQGIPGLLFFLLLLGAMLYYAQRLYHRVKDIFYKTVAMTTGVILTMLIVVNFLSDLVETDKIGSLFFLCLSALIVTDMNTRKESDSSPDIQRIS